MSVLDEILIESLTKAASESSADLERLRTMNAGLAADLEQARSDVSTLTQEVVDKALVCLLDEILKFTVPVQGCHLSTSRKASAGLNSSHARS